jgi:hypothetical protein
MNQPDDLDLTLHQTFDHRWRIAEYTAISALSAVCVAALAGALGSGALSHAVGHFDGSMARTLSYERIVRNHGSSWMKIGLTKDISGPVSVHLDTALADSVSVESIIPRPSATVASGNGITYTFDVTGTEGASLDFEISPYRFGAVHATVAVGDAHIGFMQWVLP